MAGKWSVDSWIKNPTEKADLLHAITTWQNGLSNMSGLAAFYEDLEKDKPIAIDLLLQTADFSIQDHFQVNSYLGNIFELHVLGTAPITMTMSFILLGNDSKTGKAGLMNTYINILRAEACAVRKKLPVLRLPNMCIAGAVTTLSISDDSNFQDMHTVNMSMNVFSISIVNGSNIIYFDYQHGKSKIITEDTKKESQTQVPATETIA